MKSVSSLLFASLLFTIPMAHAMEPENVDQPGSIAQFMQGLPWSEQIQATARCITGLQITTGLEDLTPETKADNLEIVAEAIAFLIKGGHHKPTETQRAQLSTIAESVDSYLAQNAALVESPNGRYLAAANAQLASFIASEIDLSEDEDEKEDAAQQEELDPVAAAKKRGQKYFKAKMEQASTGLAGFIVDNPEIAELPVRFAAAQTKLLKHEFKGKGISLDALRKKQLLATAQVLEKHAQETESVNSIALGLDIFKSNIKLSSQELEKLTPPAKASAKTALGLWANADWTSVLPGLQQAADSFMTCLTTVVSNYEQAAARIDGEEDGEEEEGDTATAEEQAAREAFQAEVNAAQDELNQMFADLATSSSSSASTSVELP